MLRNFLLLLLLIQSNSFAFMDEPQCYKDLKTTFFHDGLVLQALSMFKVPQSQWPLIVQQLKDRSREVPQIIKQRANNLTPNPLEYPFDPKTASDLLIATLKDIFSQVMHEDGIYNDRDIQLMFSYILQNQQDRLDRCLPIVLPKPMPKK